jgi:hypothetical protein
MNVAVGQDSRAALERSASAGAGWYAWRLRGLRGESHERRRGAGIQIIVGLVIWEV